MTDSKQEALKPCPFCGGEPTVSESKSGKLYVRQIRCYACEPMPHVIGNSKYKDQLYLNTDKVWNTRALQEEVVEVDLSGSISRAEKRARKTSDCCRKIECETIALVYEVFQETYAGKTIRIKGDGRD